MNEPFIREAERLGFRDLVNMATLKIPLHGNGIVSTMTPNVFGWENCPNTIHDYRFDQAWIEA